MRARRLPHRSTYILVFDGIGRLFVHLRTAAKDIYPSHWDVAIGGVLGAGEDWDAGAARELREELGVDAPLEPLFPFHFIDGTNDVHGRVYRAVHEGPFRLQPEEVVRGEFVEVAEVARRAASAPFCPDGLAVLARLASPTADRR